METTEKNTLKAIAINREESMRPIAYRYPGKIDSAFGVALVLPSYKIFTTYTGNYDPE